MLKEFREWKKERRKRLAFAAGNKEYLLNSFADKAFLEKCLQVVERNNVVITVWLLDGSRMDIKPIERSTRRKGVINGDE